MTKSDRLMLEAIFILFFIVALLCAGIYWNTIPEEDGADRSCFIGVEVEEDNWYHITKVVEEGSITLYLKALTPTEIKQAYTESYWLFAD